MKILYQEDNITTADTLSPCVVILSAVVELTLFDKRVTAFHEEGVQLSVPFQS